MITNILLNHCNWDVKRAEYGFDLQCAIVGIWCIVILRVSDVWFYSIVLFKKTKYHAV